MKRVLVLTDNEILLSEFKNIIDEKGLSNNNSFNFNYGYSFSNVLFSKKYRTTNWIKPINVKDSQDLLIDKYDLILSLHNSQIFPGKLVNSVKCINVHPGLNPFNRGWFPHVFSIINGLPCGVTIHEMNEQIDSGPIIFQKEIKIESWDTSFTLYNKIIKAEVELLNRHIENILRLDYETFIIRKEGNLNTKSDYKRLCKIDLNDTNSFMNHINRLRALSHGDYMNAYFIDKKGKIIFIKIELKEENSA